MSGHVVMIGLGSVGMQVLDGLLERAQDVVVVERDATIGTSARFAGGG